MKKWYVIYVNPVGNIFFKCAYDHKRDAKQAKDDYNDSVIQNAVDGTYQFKAFVWWTYE